MSAKTFFEALDTPGGHISILFGLVIVGIVSHYFGFPEAKTIVAGAVGALMYSLRLNGRIDNQLGPK